MFACVVPLICYFGRVCHVRLEKRVMVPLPSAAAREAMVRKHLTERTGDEVDFAQVAAMIASFLTHTTMHVFDSLS